MIGNDVREDMEPCEQRSGIDTFLVTDHLITHKLPYSPLPASGAVSHQ